MPPLKARVLSLVRGRPAVSPRVAAAVARITSAANEGHMWHIVRASLTAFGKAGLTPEQRGSRGRIFFVAGLNDLAFKDLSYAYAMTRKELPLLLLSLIALRRQNLGLVLIPEDKHTLGYTFFEAEAARLNGQRERATGSYEHAVRDGHLIMKRNRRMAGIVATACAHLGWIEEARSLVPAMPDPIEFSGVTARALILVADNDFDTLYSELGALTYDGWVVTILSDPACSDVYREERFRRLLVDAHQRVEAVRREVAELMFGSVQTREL